MGKGDKKTKRGKIIAGSYGVRRLRKKKNKEFKPVDIKKPSKKKKPASAKKEEKPKTAKKGAPQVKEIEESKSEKKTSSEVNEVKKQEKVPDKGKATATDIVEEPQSKEIKEEKKEDKKEDSKEEKKGAAVKSEDKEKE